MKIKFICTIRPFFHNFTKKSAISKKKKKNLVTLDKTQGRADLRLLGRLTVYVITDWTSTPNMKPS